MKKAIHIIGGGTINTVRPHTALCAPAFGTVARQLQELCIEQNEKDGEEFDIFCHLTKMADYKSKIKTNDDLEKLVDQLVGDPLTKIIFMTAAICDHRGLIENDSGYVDSDGRFSDIRLDSKKIYKMNLLPSSKIIGKIRKKRKDIFLVGFKTTSGDSQAEQYLKGLNLCKTASCNLVLANDIKTEVNMVITPEEAAYYVGERQTALENLVDMAFKRSRLTFTRSTVVDGELIDWSSEMIPDSLRTIVDYCISMGAYQSFNGSTVGHFAHKIDDSTFLTSIRKSNFNKDLRLVKVRSYDKDSVIAHGARPSVGGQSQRIIFKEHADKGYDCIVHFHCEMKTDVVPIRSQRDVECGSHECGKNTSDGLKDFGEFSAVMLENHGPNIVFNKNIDPFKIIKFIEQNFDLTQKTGGFNVQQMRVEDPHGQMVYS